MASFQYLFSRFALKKLFLSFFKNFKTIFSFDQVIERWSVNTSQGEGGWVDKPFSRILNKIFSTREEFLKLRDD